jgi:hypothetical protein
LIRLHWHVVSSYRAAVLALTIFTVDVGRWLTVLFTLTMNVSCLACFGSP